VTSAMERMRELGARDAEAQYRALRGDFLRELDRGREARADYGAALHDARERKARPEELGVRARIAELELDEGKVVEGELRAVLGELESLKAAPVRRASVLEQLARALLASRKVEEARVEIDAATALEAREPLVRARVSGTLARVEAAAGDCSGARERMRTAISEVDPGGAATRPPLDLSLELKLARAQVAARCGDRTLLRAIAQEARTAGFKRIARQAAATR
jgi:hypothetical protein